MSLVLDYQPRPAVTAPIETDPRSGGAVAVPMAGHDIVCFAKDFSDVPTSNHHVMLELARNNKVLWINSVATRAPNLTSGRDIKRIFRKLAGFFRGARRMGPNLWVYTPIVLPFPHSRFAQRFNRGLLRFMIGRLRRKLRMTNVQLWTFLPNVDVYVGALGERISVYYCVDEWSKFTYLNGANTAEAEQRLLRKVDLVFATAQSLVDARLPINPRTYLARHGVQREQFAAAMDARTRIPADIADLPKPILGFYGTIQDWIDQDLICHLAQRHPNWSIVMIGGIFTDVSKLKRFPNIHLLGRREHPQLPAYCKGFDVGIIPYVLHERILHVNPIKLREFLSAGLPVVSTAFPEAQLYPQFCDAVATPQQFDTAVVAALASDSPQLHRQRSEAMRGETWEKKVALLCRHVTDRLQSKNGGGTR
jgi:glycosyltransferase involved in cell wall biosynthesis